MVLLPDEDEDERFLKKGPELFKELLRVYPVAEVEDYYKAGQWKDDVMKTDLQLVEAHRLEAGAPDAPPLEEVKMPELPKDVPGQPAALGARPALPGLSALMGVRAPMPAVAGAPAAAPAASPVADLRLIALFVAKWKIDATKTKELLAKLAPERRRYVIQNFNGTTAGDEAFAELEKYIEECEKTEAWGPLPAPGTLPANGVRPAVAPGGFALAGIKRPLGAVVPGVQDPSKRPKAGMITGPMPGALAARPGVMAGRPPVSMGLGRPVVPGVRPGLRPPVTVQAVRPGMRPMAPGQQGQLLRGLVQRF